MSADTSQFLVIKRKGKVRVHTHPPPACCTARPHTHTSVSGSSFQSRAVPTVRYVVCNYEGTEQAVGSRTLWVAGLNLCRAVDYFDRNDFLGCCALQCRRNFPTF
jgi:hypothetical protein